VASTYVLADTADKAGKAHKVLTSPNTLCFFLFFCPAGPRSHNPDRSWPLFLSKSEMKFLDNNWTKDMRVFCIHAIHSLSTGGLIKKTSFCSGFEQINTKKILEI
jgi:hypothetical protein